jgi:hypothetical protein
MGNYIRASANYKITFEPISGKYSSIFGTESLSAMMEL